MNQGLSSEQVRSSLARPLPASSTTPKDGVSTAMQMVLPVSESNHPLVPRKWTVTASVSFTLMLLACRIFALRMLLERTIVDQGGF